MQSIRYTKQVTRECDITGERKLFKAIIVRAVEDAFSKNKEKSSLDKRQARYFLCDDPAFQDYCDFAGVSASRLRKMSRKLSAMPDEESTALFKKLWREDICDI